MDKMRVEIEGYEVLEKVVTKSGNGGHLSVPIAWLGCRCKVILLDPSNCALQSTKE
mgnify:CR=1 FL=1